MSQKHKPRTDQEWLDLIQECRSSGMTDAAWCELHGICRTNFYYHIRQLKKKACEIPDNQVKSFQECQEVVAIDFTAPLPEENISKSEACDYQKKAAIRLEFSGFSIEILNGADGTTIRDTIAALRQIC
jgi:hypothetical protein